MSCNNSRLLDSEPSSQCVWECYNVYYLKNQKLNLQCPLNCLWKLFCAIWSSFIEVVTCQQPPTPATSLCCPQRETSLLVQSRSMPLPGLQWGESWLISTWLNTSTFISSLLLISLLFSSLLVSHPSLLFLTTFIFVS